MTANARISKKSARELDTEEVTDFEGYASVRARDWAAVYGSVGLTGRLRMEPTSLIASA
jgi:hypothetical protein